MFGFGKQAGRPCSFLRCIREPRCGRRPNGFQGLSTPEFGRTSLGQAHGVPGTVEPVEVGFVVGDPFLDRLPGWLDRLHGLDVERRRRWAGELDDAFPQAVETEEEFDLLGPFDGTCEFHGSFAARALEWIGSPDFEDEVAPEGTHGASALLGRCWDEEDFGLGILDFRLMIVDCWFWIVGLKKLE